jgi:hypothetical protein
LVFHRRRYEILIVLDSGLISASVAVVRFITIDDSLESSLLTLD